MIGVGVRTVKLGSVGVGDSMVRSPIGSVGWDTDSLVGLAVGMRGVLVGTRGVLVGTREVGVELA
jgi:hypothetical protein